MKTQIIIIVIFFLSISCNIQQNEKQSSDISKYLQEIHKIENIVGNPILIFIPISSCSFCQKEAIRFLHQQRDIPENVFIIIAGLNNAEITPYKQQLRKFRVHLLVDKGYQYNKYKALVGNEPFYAYLDDKKTVKKTEINAGNYNFVLPHLEKILKFQ